MALKKTSGGEDIVTNTIAMNVMIMVKVEEANINNAIKTLNSFPLVIYYD